MADLYKHDDLLIHILKEEGQIVPFLDAIFGFLHRRTDFYIIQDNPNAKFGFPVGVAERVTRETFRKWQQIAAEVVQNDSLALMENCMTELVIHEEEVVTSESVEDLPATVLPTEQHKSEKHQSQEDLTCDIYNGADCGTYRWAQTATEVDIKVPVASSVAKSNNVKVDIQACQLTVKVRSAGDDWDTVVDGQLAFKHHKDESIWTLLPGKQISIHLEKSGERWWDRLLTTETGRDLTSVDATRDVADLPPEDQMQVEKVMVQEERKRLGLESLEHQEKLNLLKKAWNIEGSPFQGTAFDPSVLNPS
uniref:CS domain-containing protein n=1 Tax=Graphocephala atropunctata TaxID=36148 RepID=A0A1B6KVN7_9HEMI